MTASDRSVAMARVVNEASLDKLGENIVALDVSIPFALTDIFMFVSARNERQVVAISDGIEEKMLENKYKLIRKEGKTTARWILMDYGDIIIHVMHEQERVFYDIERLWKDAPAVKL